MKTLQIFRSFNYVKDGCQQFAETKTTPKISAKRTCPGYLLLLFTENNNCVSMKDSTHGSDIFSRFSFKQLLCNTLFTHLFLKTTFISTIQQQYSRIYQKKGKSTDFQKFKSGALNPNWHEAGRISPPYNFWIGFCQLNFYQKFPNIFGSEN